MATDNFSEGDNFKVKLSHHGRTIVFKASPDIIENRNVNYKTLDPVHMPGQFHVYQNTSSRSFNVSNIKLISRTTEEADRNLATINLIRSWTLPYFGRSTLSEEQRLNRKTGKQHFDTIDQQDRNNLFGREYLGAPPPVLKFSAYSDGRRTKNIYKIPVVVINLTVPFPGDVDYIPTSDGTPVPIMQTLDLQLSEVHSPNEYEKFSLAAYRNGTLGGF